MTTPAFCLTLATAIALSSPSAAVASAPMPMAETCGETIGVDMTHAQRTINQFLGGSVGESFIARDTLIKSIAVWRDQGAGDWRPRMKLWIMRADSDGVPSEYAEDVLLEGPTIAPPGDSVTRAPVKVEYRFDPPFRLPALGWYGFFIQDPCSFTFDLYINETDNVFPGRLFRTSRGSNPFCLIRGITDQFYESVDLIFEIEFCSQVPTPVRIRSWGQLKIIYR